MSDLAPDTPATQLRIDILTTEPAQIRIDYNAVSKAIGNYIGRLVKSGWLSLIREQCGDGGCPLALLFALLDVVKAKDSAKILMQTGRLIVWPTHRTLQTRTGYGRAAIFNACQKLEAMGAIKRLESGGGRDSSTFEIFGPPDDDSPVYWGGRVNAYYPSTRIDRYGSIGMDGPPSVGADGSGPPSQTAGARRDGPHPSAPMYPNLEGKDKITFSNKEHQHSGDGGTRPPAPAAAADGVVERMRAEGLPGYRVDELAGAPWQSLDYVNACSREAASAHSSDNRRRIGLLIHLLSGPDRCSRPRQRPADRADQDAADRRQENAKTVATVATSQHDQRRQISALATAGRLAALVTECIDQAPAELLRVRWLRVNASDPEAVADHATLAAAVCARAIQSH